MDARATELWSHAPAIIQKLEAAIKQNTPAAREELLAVLGIDGGPLTVEDSKPGIDDFEYALQAAVLDRLEPGDPAQAREREAQVPRALEVAADVVAALLDNTAAPEVSAAETDRCKSWWMIFVQIAEETTKLVPLGQLEELMGVFERSLMKLRKAALALSAQRLREFDAKQEAEAKALKDAAPETNKSEARVAKEAKEREAKRLDERKKLISQLGVSPNGHVFLTMTSLLKQLSSRLIGSFNCRLRTRISLILERLLALDHKAIANNQKARAQDFFTMDDLDVDVKVLPYSLDVTEPAPEALKPEAEAPVVAEEADAAAPAEAAAEAPANGNSVPEEKHSSLGHDPTLQYNDYTGFWALQESLQVVEKIFEKPENWKHFNTAMTKLLKQFEKYPTSAEQREPWTAPSNAPQRQVPRARAFRVQMDDPQLRIQFLTQVLIAFQALEQDVTSKGNRLGGLISTQPEAIYAQLKELRSTIEKVLNQTRAGVGSMVTHVLARESHWVNWKGMGCREWEHDSLEMLTGKAQDIDVIATNSVWVPKTDKPKLDATVNSLLKEVKGFTPPVVETPRTDAEGRPEPCALEIRRLCESALDRHEMEEDPANGIEEEYRGRHNKAFMWQSRRLFGRHHIRVYARKEVSGKTDFMDFVRSARNRNPPPPEPAKEPEAAPAAAPAEAPPIAEVLEAAVAAAEAVATEAPAGEGAAAAATAAMEVEASAAAPATAEEAPPEGEPAAAQPVLDDGYGPPVDDAAAVEPPTKKARVDA